MLTFSRSPQWRVTLRQHKLKVATNLLNWPSSIQSEPAALRRKFVPKELNKLNNLITYKFNLNLTYCGREESIWFADSEEAPRRVPGSAVRIWACKKTVSFLFLTISRLFLPEALNALSKLSLQVSGTRLLFSHRCMILDHGSLLSYKS